MGEKKKKTQPFRAIIRKWLRGCPQAFWARLVTSQAQKSLVLAPFPPLCPQEGPLICGGKEQGDFEEKKKKKVPWEDRPGLIRFQVDRATIILLVRHPLFFF